MSNQPANDTAQHDVDPRSAPIDEWPTGIGADEFKSAFRSRAPSANIPLEWPLSPPMPDTARSD
jgi:hypothetical protein